MKTVTIDLKDFDFLVKSGLNIELVLRLKEAASIEFGNVHFTLSHDEIGTILEYLDMELAKRGFDLNDEPNKYGTRLENLIDKFSREHYE